MRSSPVPRSRHLRCLRKQTLNDHRLFWLRARPEKTTCSGNGLICRRAAGAGLSCSAALGTLVCILVAFAIDSFSFETGTWRWGTAPWNNMIIPLVLAPPFFVYLLSKLRELADCPSRAQHRRVDRRADLLPQPARLHGDGRCLSRTRRQREEAKREGALLIIDVDHFKNVNDSFGHECGDEALKIIAQTIKGVVREIDLVGRIGGEEFSVFLPGTDANRTQVVAERIRAAISTVEFYPTENRCDLSVSVGGATYDRRGDVQRAVPAGRPAALCRQAERPQPRRDPQRAGAKRPRPARGALSSSVGTLPTRLANRPSAASRSYFQAHCKSIKRCYDICCGGQSSDCVLPIVVQ